MIEQSDEKKSYDELQDRQQRQWEEKCVSCGMCCGVKDGDSCEHLILKDNKYFCEVYDHRFGMHKTKNGKDFRCVPIRNIIHKAWPGGERCAYK